MGPKGETRGRCQPPSFDQHRSTMWSVKCRPNPGSARMTSRSETGRGSAFGVTAQARARSATGSWMVMSPSSTAEGQHATGRGVAVGTIGRMSVTARTITTVVFDLGGVLIDWDPRHLYRQLFADPQEMEVFLRDVVSPDWNAQQDSGRTWAEATAELIAQHPDHEDMIHAYVERWQDMLAGPIQGTVEVLREVRERGLAVYALTNWSAETFPRARGMFPFLEWFGG